MNRSRWAFARRLFLPVVDDYSRQRCRPPSVSADMTLHRRYPISLRTTQDSPFLPGGLLDGFVAVEPSDPNAQTTLARTLIHVVTSGVQPTPNCLLGRMRDLRLAAVAHTSDGFRTATRATRNKETTCWSNPPCGIALYEAAPPFAPEVAEPILTALLRNITLADACRRETEVRDHGVHLLASYAGTTASSDLLINGAEFHKSRHVIVRSSDRS